MSSYFWDGVIFFLMILVVVLIVVVPVVVPFKITWNTGGMHSGYVTAIEKHGFFFKKYRVYFKTDVSSSQEDKYCVEDNHNDLISKLESASESKQRITIKYQDNSAGAYKCDGDEIVGIK